MTTGSCRNVDSEACPLLRVRGLGMDYPVRSAGFLRRVVGRVTALDGVTFDLMRGETLGVVGESGSGKTTLARCLLRALRPTRGSALFRVDSEDWVDLAVEPEPALRSLRPRLQMIFQDPYSSLNPHMTVADIVAEPLIIHRMARGDELGRRVVEMLTRVGLEPSDGVRYPHAFSGGQRQRIGIARALIMNPDLLVADEPVSALDVSVQAQVINLLRHLQRELGLTTIFIAHDLGLVRHICDRVAVMKAGRIVELARARDIFANPAHPYTRLLLSSIPSLDPGVRPRLDGSVADFPQF